MTNSLYNIVEKYIKLEDKEEIELASIKFETMFTPGHTSGSMCYLIKNENILLNLGTPNCICISCALSSIASE